MSNFGRFYLDQEKDIVVDLNMENDVLHYTLRTPNHHTGNLITNLAKLCDLPLSFDDQGLKQIEGVVPAYLDSDNRKVYIFRLGGTKCANIYPDGTIERKAAIPAISKTLMSQTKNYQLSLEQTIIKSYILEDLKFRTDLHTHMNANLHPDTLIALGIVHQVRYPLYYVKKLGLRLTEKQIEQLVKDRQVAKEKFKDSPLTGKYLTRKIDDNTFINFADLILHNLENADYNLPKIRASLTILKDGQTVFTNLEKVYLYRYIFAKGVPSKDPIELHDYDITRIPDREIRAAVFQMLEDDRSEHYKDFTLFQDKLLWIARMYQSKGITLAEISDTGLVKKDGAPEMLAQIHQAMPAIYEETKVRILFLAALRRIPLAIVKDQIQSADYQDNLETVQAVAMDPYVAGSDILGEEINDIRDLKPVIAQLVKIAKDEPSFVIRIHAGENDGIRDNVLNSVLLVEDCLAPGQSMPEVRIGHGLYTANLASLQGKKLLQKLKEDNVTLEFQITSNVRLNNLSSLSNHPLKSYLKAGVRCVQGTDGGAIYGSNSIDEQLSLERLLKLERPDFEAMRQVEDQIIARANQAFEAKMAKYQKLAQGKSCQDFYKERIAKADTGAVSLYSKSKTPSLQAFGDEIAPLPKDKLPIILMGGSFNSDKHATRMRPEGKELITKLLQTADPDSVYFVIGHRLKGYESFLVAENQKREKPFTIFAFVPGAISAADETRLKNNHLPIRVALEPEELGIYKSVSYEIFKRRPSILIALDGNSAALNMIQDAKNAKYKSLILLFQKCMAFKTKASTLSGYTQLFDQADEALKQVEHFLATNSPHQPPLPSQLHDPDDPLA